jgi:GTP-binding protein HflX
MRKAILADVIHPRMRGLHSLERMRELEELVRTYGGIVVVKTFQRRFAPHPKTFLGLGKVDALAQEGKVLEADLLVINDLLKPRQIYEIGERLRQAKIEVWDRIDLILKIFAKHAHTTEAKLEIELASIRHMGPRIFGMGMELSRQGGGIGTSGIGETNTEIMRRHLREREQIIKEKLEKCLTVREGHRVFRRRQGLKTVSIVGYTNAGKTSLLNALTGRREYAANKLFATLDTRVGSLWLPRLQRKILVSDTIGFIKHLPPELVNAFSSTLSEAVEADALLQVLDAADSRWWQHLQVVEEVLTRLQIKDKPRILICHKSDQVSARQRKVIDRKLADTPHVWASAQAGDGIEGLVEAIESALK